MATEQNRPKRKLLRNAVIAAAAGLAVVEAGAKIVEDHFSTPAIASETPVVLSNGYDVAPWSESYYIKGPSTISENAFLHVLADANSPMSQQTAQEVYDMLLQKGFNPALFLAIFEQESHYGTTGMARETLNACNIRPWRGVENDPVLKIAHTSNGSFVDFSGFGQNPSTATVDGYDGWWHSFDACSNNADALAGRDSNDIEQLIYILTPPDDGNDTSSYVARVKDAIKNYYELSLRLKDAADRQETTLSINTTTTGTIALDEYYSQRRG